MTSTKKNILITGLPGVGKTTLIRRLADEFKDLNPSGFYTAEIRKSGRREGFELESFDDRRAILSRVDIHSPYRVGKYGVHVAAFEDFLRHIPFDKPSSRLVIIDEIGKMECFSSLFKAVMKDLLDSGKPVVATVAMKGGGFIAEVKQRDDVLFFELRERNRESLFQEILHIMKKRT